MTHTRDNTPNSASTPPPAMTPRAEPNGMIWHGFLRYIIEERDVVSRAYCIIERLSVNRYYIRGDLPVDLQQLVQDEDPAFPSPIAVVPIHAIESGEASADDDDDVEGACFYLCDVIRDADALKIPAFTWKAILKVPEPASDIKKNTTTHC